MKKIKTIMMLAIVALLASCSSDDEITENKPANGREVIIGVSMPEDTRVALNNDLLLTWEAGDQLIVAPEQEDGKLLNAGTVFKMISEPGQKTAQFKGVLPEGSKYSIYYKAKNLKYYESDNRYGIDYSGITQNGINNSAHIKNYLDLFNPGVNKDKLQNFDLFSEIAILRIDVRSLPEEVTSINNIKWFINYDGDEYTKREMGSVTFNGEIKNLTSDKEHNYIYLPFFGSGAFEQQKDKKMALEIYGKTSIAVVHAVATTSNYLSHGMYDMIVTTDKNAQQALNQWNVKTAKEGPATNEVWVKFVEGATKNNTIKDYYEVEYTLSAEPNAEGWYVYSRVGAITDAMYLFNRNNTITEAWLPGTMTTIPYCLFYNCSTLTNVKISPDTEVIGEEAFRFCTELKDFVVPKKVTTLEKRCFYCNDFGNKTFTILTPKTVLTSIHSNAFAGAKTENCNLYIHQSWKDDVKDNTWTYISSDEAQSVSLTFRSVHFVDDNGKEVTL